MVRIRVGVRVRAGVKVRVKVRVRVSLAGVGGLRVCIRVGVRPSGHISFSNDRP